MNNRVLEKYTHLRPFLKKGDIVLFRGNRILAKIIQNCDSSYFNHTGVIIECSKALGICDANGGGVQWDRLSWRMRKYVDFCVLRPLASEKEVETQLELLLKRSDDKWLKYDFLNGLKGLINRKLKKSIFTIKPLSNKFICSTEISNYAISLGMVTEEFSNIVLPFPEDYARYCNRQNTQIIN